MISYDKNSQHVKRPHLDQSRVMAVECVWLSVTFMQLCTCLRYLRENAEACFLQYLLQWQL